jgi:hypothetical protein
MSKERRSSIAKVAANIAKNGQGGQPKQGKI